MSSKSANKMFGIEDNSLINLFSDDNPILNVNEKCFFIFHNNTNKHIPIIGYGEIIADRFTSGMDKIYTIQLLKIHSNPYTIDNHVIGNIFSLHGVHGNRFKTKRNVKINNHNWKKSIFDVNCFFVRTTLVNINKLNSDYVGVIAEDLHKQLNELNLSWHNTKKI